MNALGIVITWTAVQVTLFCLAGAAVYFAARRLNPAWRATLLYGILLITVGIAALAISPWPRWLTLGDTRRPAKPMTPDAATTRANQRAPTAAATAGGVDGTSKQTTKTGGGPIAISFLSGMWRRVQNELADKPPTGVRGRQWRWPSWLAIAALSATGIGVARVLLGLATLARLMRNTACVIDSSMIGLVEQLRGQLHCRPSIELREMPAAGAAGSPALIGWRRPVILLPGDWRGWSDDARRGVLAHEIAHVAHGDFLMWLAAQAGVVVHFYNPLVHWLAARLRLEQELAADARGAAIVGGTRTYAALLARMALRQDDAQPLWAGCPFFPTRGTLMRRIEMLSNQRMVTPDSPSRIARTCLLAAFALCGFAIAGLRGSSDAARADGPAPEQAPSESAKPDSKEDLLPAFDRSYLPAETIAVVSIKSLTVANSIVAVEPAFNLPPNMIGFGFLPSDKDQTRRWSVEEVKMIVLRSEPSVDSPSETPASVEPPMLIVYRFRDRHDPREWRDRISEESSGTVTETTVRGLPCFRVAGTGADDAVNYLLPDDRTILIMRQRDMARVLAADAEHHPGWYGRWLKVADQPLAVAVDSAIVAGLENDPADALEKVFVATLRESKMIFGQIASTASGLEISVTALCQSPEKAAATTGVVKDGVAIGLEVVPQALAPSLLPRLLPKEYQPLDFVGPLVQTLSDLAVNVQGTQVDVEAKLDAGFVAQFVEATRAYNDALGKASDQGHIEKLGQLAKAFADYHAAHGHYPPAAVVGPDGKTVHSWRVELLPYLGEQKLFDDYKLDEPWDGEHNKQLVEKIPEIYHASPWKKNGEADYFVVTGKGTLFDGDVLSRRESITDAPGETVLVLQSHRRVPWTRPVDVESPTDQGPAQSIRGLGHGFYAAFADGTVKFVSQDTDATSVRAMFTKAGGDQVKLR